MMRSSRWWLAALTVVVAAVPAPAAPVPAEHSALAQVPATAPLVIQIRGVEGVKERLEAFLKNALPDVLAQIQPRLDSMAKDGVNGRKVTGVPKDGPIFIVLLEMPKMGESAPPKMAVVAAVTKYDEFRDGLLKEDERKGLKPAGAGIEKTSTEGSDTYFVDLKGYAAVTPSEEVATALTKKPAGLDTKLSKDQASRLLAADASLYVSMDTINKDYGDQIKQGREFLENIIGQAGENVPQTQRASIDLVKKAIGPIFQAVEDSQGVLATATLRPDAVLVHAQTNMRNGSKTSTLLSEFKVDEFQGLEKMPGGEMIYMGTATTAKLLDKMGALLTGLGGGDEKAMKVAGEAMEAMAKAGPGVRLDAAGVPASGLQVWHFDDPAKAVAAQLQLAKNMGEGGAFQGGVVKDKPTVKEGAEKYKDISFNSVELTWDLDKMAEQAAKGGMGLSDEAKKQLVDAFKTILGEKLHYWFGTDGKVYLQVTAKDWASAEALLDRYFKGEKSAGGVAAFTGVRKELPAKATMVVLADAVQYVGVIANVAKPLVAPVFPLPPGYPAKVDKDNPTFVGVAASLVPDQGSFDLVVSAAAVKEGYKSFVVPLMPGGTR
jgi:hypothetical protein